MADLEIVRAWFESSKRHLLLAKRSLEDQSVMNEGVVFHAYAASEKSVKGFMIYSGIDLKDGQGLEKLGQLISIIDPNLIGILEPLSSLVRISLKHLSLGSESQMLSEQELSQIVKLAEIIFDETISRMPIEVVPN